MLGLLGKVLRRLTKGRLAGKYCQITKTYVKENGLRHVMGEEGNNGSFTLSS